MKRFSLHLDTRIEFGEGVIERIGEEAAVLGKRAVLLYGKESIKKNGVYDVIVRSLKDHGVEWIEHPGVSPNPVLSHAAEGVDKARAFGADVIVAAGGGSVIDEAKGIALGTASGEAGSELWKYYTRERKAEKALPIVAVQTMPATSSEMNEASVLTHEETREKFSVRAHVLAPRAALLDPSVTVNIPLPQTAYACTDIISHLTEGFFSNSDDFAPVQEGFALGLASAVRRSMDAVLRDPSDIKARSAIMWAGTLGWNGTGAAGWEGAGIPCHTLEHPMSGLYNIPHGAGLSIVTPAYLKLRKDAVSDRIVTFARTVLGREDVEQADQGISALEAWYRKIGTPESFSAWKEVPSFDIDLLTQEAEKLDGIWNASGFKKGEIRRTFELMQ